AFYDLSKAERVELASQIAEDIEKELSGGSLEKTLGYFSDEDTYIRKAAYQSVGELYRRDVKMQPKVIKRLKELMQHEDFHVRQTTINAAGEIGKKDFEAVQWFFDTG